MKEQIKFAWTHHHCQNCTWNTHSWSFAFHSMKWSCCRIRSRSLSTHNHLQIVSANLSAVSRFDFVTRLDRCAYVHVAFNTVSILFGQVHPAFYSYSSFLFYNGFLSKNHWWCNSWTHENMRNEEFCKIVAIFCKYPRKLKKRHLIENKNL